MEKRKCPYCPKVIEGYNTEHVEKMLKQHVIFKHPDKTIINEVKK